VKHISTTTVHLMHFFFSSLDLPYFSLKIFLIVPVDYKLW